MFRHLLVPLDGSPLAEAALSAALTLSAKFDSEITLLRVVPSLNVIIDGAAVMESLLDFRRQVFKEAETYLKMHQSSLRQQGYKAHRHLREGDSIAEIILDVAKGRDIDMIVMSTHGRGGVARWVFGSVADKVLRHAQMPVLLIRAQEDGAILPAPQFKHLLVPLDGSQLAENALPMAQELAANLQSKVTLLRVTKTPYTPADVSGHAYGELVAVLQDEMRQEASDYLAATEQMFDRQGVEVDSEVLTGSPTAKVILDIVRQRHVDAIVMSTHGRGGISRWVYGSVADRILQSASVPVFLIRASETPETPEQPLEMAVPL
jgi:nucleotide-binding universal stress UspA family protein